MFDIPMNEKPAMSFGGGSTNNAGTTQNQFGNSMNSGSGFGNANQNQFGAAPANNMNNSFGAAPVSQFNSNNAGNMGSTANAGYGNTQAQNMAVNTQHFDKKAKGGVILQKGVKSKLVGAGGGTTPQRIRVCLGWDVAPGYSYDLDSSCFLLGSNNKAVGDEWFVFYNQPQSPDGAVVHLGDSRDGAGDGDDETITVNLAGLSQSVARMAFVITIADAIENGYDFTGVRNAYARIVDDTTGKELALFNIPSYEKGMTAMAVFEVYRYNGEWKINPVGNGLKNTGLLELCQFYGVNVAG